MGATYDEVVADYLKTYTNYYTVVDGKQQPLSEETLASIADANIIKTLKRAFGVEDLKTANLAEEATDYITELGLTADEIAALKTNLGATAAPPTPATASYEVATSVSAGDKIIYVVNYNDKTYALTSDSKTISNALTATEVTITDGKITEPAEDVVWELSTGTADGSYTLKSAAGTYISYGGSGTSLSLGETGVDLSLVLGVGTSKIQIASYPSRYLFLRDNNGALQFRAYAAQNESANGYCNNLTIYKLAEG